MTKYKSKFTGQQIDDGIEYGVRVTQQTFSSAQKQQARENIGVTPEVQVGGNTPASDSGVKLFVDESTDDTVEVYTKAQAAGQFVAVVNMNTEPTESTLTYTSTDGTTKNFKVGDEVRVPDAEADNGYTFYKLYAIVSGEAVWDKLGAGGAAPVNPNETVNISLTQIGGNSADLTGASITITDDDSGDTLYTTTWAGSMITTEIDVNTNYTVSVETIAGYFACAPQSYQAGYQIERNISFQYIAPSVYVEATDGTLYTSSAWTSSGKTANAVVVLTDACKVRMALTETTLPIHSVSTPDPLENYITAIADATNAKLDYDGEGNTDKIIQFNAAYNSNTTSYAAPYCKAFSFTYPSGQKGCLPSAGQLWTIYQNKTEVNACLTACGGTAMSTSNWNWASTFSCVYGGASHRYNWSVNWVNGEVYDRTINNEGQVRPVSTYEI